MLVRIFSRRLFYLESGNRSAPCCPLRSCSQTLRVHQKSSNYKMMVRCGSSRLFPYIKNEKVGWFESRAQILNTQKEHHQDIKKRLDRVWCGYHPPQCGSITARCGGRVQNNTHHPTQIIWTMLYGNCLAHPVTHVTTTHGFLGRTRDMCDKHGLRCSNTVSPSPSSLPASSHRRRLHSKSSCSAKPRFQHLARSIRSFSQSTTSEDPRLGQNVRPPGAPIPPTSETLKESTAAGKPLKIRKIWRFP